MAKHTGIPQITEVYGHYLSAECSRYGDGQCDGLINDPTGEYDGEECACSCHKEHTDCPQDTIANVAAWHAEQYRLFG